MKRPGKPRAAARKLLTRGAANRAYAHKKLQWVVPFSAVCKQICTTPADSCPNRASIVLVETVGANSLITSHEDAMTVVRIEGDLWFKPEDSSALSTCVQIAQDLANAKTIFRMGLKKGQVSQGSGGNMLPWNPLNSGATADDLSDYADGKWAHLWPAHMFQSRQTVGYFQQPVPTYSNTFGGLAVNALLAGTGNINTAVSTVCAACDVEPPLLCNNSYELAAPLHVRVRINRRLKFTGDEHLTLYMGWERQILCAESTRPIQQNLTMWGQIRMLIEK